MKNTVYEHKKAGFRAEFAPINQRTLESYFEKFREFSINGGSGTEANGTAVRAASAVGWLIGISPEAVDDMPPVQVLWLAQKVNQEYMDVTTIPTEEDDSSDRDAKEEL